MPWARVYFLGNVTLIQIFEIARVERIAWLIVAVGIVIGVAGNRLAQPDDSARRPRGADAARAGAFSERPFRRRRRQTPRSCPRTASSPFRR